MKTPSLSTWIFYMCYEKAIFHSFAYEFATSYKSRRSRVYHQDKVLHITNSVGIVYHHCESGIQPMADEIHATRDDIQS